MDHTHLLRYAPFVPECVVLHYVKPKMYCKTGSFLQAIYPTCMIIKGTCTIRVPLTVWLLFVVQGFTQDKFVGATAERIPIDGCRKQKYIRVVPNSLPGAGAVE